MLCKMSRKITLIVPPGFKNLLIHSCHDSGNRAPQQILLLPSKCGWNCYMFFHQKYWFFPNWTLQGTNIPVKMTGRETSWEHPILEVTRAMGNWLQYLSSESSMVHSPHDCTTHWAFGCFRVGLSLILHETLKAFRRLLAQHRTCTTMYTQTANSNIKSFWEREKLFPTWLCS